MNQFYLLHFNVFSNAHHHNAGLISVPTDKRAAELNEKMGRGIKDAICKAGYTHMMRYFEFVEVEFQEYSKETV
ncbi:hypothetical protein [Lysinibacillus xylanilyticus]|uniref:Uncharacterized protein n=1 Tax=Lysinibacillus xylanilyticus TaxID=582475 RepID=A0ABT4EQ32_9BACI|nr:hypothetical protein [Lysinibacillus xylanilyticus]MCY9547628.1 hypothetical protein [Lysinibacillus xylanilyticus]